MQKDHDFHVGHWFWWGNIASTHTSDDGEQQGVLPNPVKCLPLVHEVTQPPNAGVRTRSFIRQQGPLLQLREYLQAAQPAFLSRKVLESAAQLCQPAGADDI